VRLDVDLGADVTLPALASSVNIAGSNVAISPDGMRLVFASGLPVRLFTRRLDQSKGTELAEIQEGYAPFFSPDGQWIGFKGTQSKVSKISVDGGAVVPLGDFGTVSGSSWGEDGNIYLVVAGKGLVRIRDGGGQPETVAALGNGELFGLPQILPGGKAVLFSAYTARNPDTASIEVVTLADRHRKTISRGGTSPRYLSSPNAASGYLVYLNKATLFAIAFDPDKLETRGTAFPILDDVASNQTLGTAQISFSRSGTLVYRRSNGNAQLFAMAWLDNAGKTQPLPAKPGAYGRPRLSPDGQRLAVAVGEGSGTDILVKRLATRHDDALDVHGNSGKPGVEPGRPVYCICIQGNRDVGDTLRWSGPAATLDPKQRNTVSGFLYGGREAVGLRRAESESLLQLVDRADRERRGGAAGGKARGFPADAGLRDEPGVLS
jgi:hypothetical protein